MSVMNLIFILCLQAFVREQNNFIKMVQASCPHETCTANI